MMKILLLGKNGQVGWELQRSLSTLGEVIALDRSLGRYSNNGLSGNLEDVEGLIKTIRQVRPDILVNAAAYTAVDKAETEQMQAIRINTDAPRLLAEEMEALGGWLVHYSTDYVFNGQGDLPWRETDPTGPLNYYGHSKLLADQYISAGGCRHLIFRTSWVYGLRGHNFARTIFNLAHERAELKIVGDQFGVPTGADLIADVTAHALRCVLVNPELGGLYHLAPRGETTWFDYAQLVVDSARSKGAPLAVHRVVPIPTADYPTPARRPTNSRLDTTKLRRNFGIHLPDWRPGVIRAVESFT